MQDEMNGAKFDDAIIRLFPLSLLMNLSRVSSPTSAWTYVFIVGRAGKCH